MAVATRPMVNDRREIFGWSMYDWANSAFSTTVVTVFLGPYLTAITRAAADSNGLVYLLNVPIRFDSYFTYIISASVLLQVTILPLLGALADYSRLRKQLLQLFCVLGSVATIGLFFITPGLHWLGGLLFIIANVSFGASIVFYNSYLPNIASEDQRDRVSAFGWAMGYLGGGLLLAINVLMIQMPDLLGITALGSRFGVDGVEMATRLSLMSVGLWWAVFSIPLFRHVPEPPRAKLEAEQLVNPIKGGFGRLARTFKELRLYRQLMIFIVAFWIYNDGIGTIIKMATIYGAEIGIGQIDLIGALLLTQFIGMPFSLMFGRLPDRNNPRQPFFLSTLLLSALAILAVGFGAPRLGITSGPVAVAIALGLIGLGVAFSWLFGQKLVAPLAQRMSTKNAILVGLAVYALVSIWGYFMATAAEFWLLAIMVGLVQGGSQALSRSLFGNMVPKAQTAEFFGFYDMSSKFAGIVGPFVFAIVGQLAGSSRLSIFSLIIFFVVGGLILSRLNEEEGIRVAREVDARALIVK